METQKPEWFDIPRESPEYVVSFGGEQHKFTYHNVKICLFPEEYKEFNHIFYNRGDKYTYIFNCEAVTDELHSFGYPMMYEPWPSDQDVEAFIASEMGDL